MKVLGIKCSKAELGWMVLEGATRANATVVAYNRPKYRPASGANNWPGYGKNCWRQSPSTVLTQLPWR